MTTAEAMAYNTAIRDMLGIVARATTGIADTNRSELFKEIATAGLHQLAQDGERLLLPMALKPGAPTQDLT